MEYDFNQLDPIKFQRLINCILIARFGEDARLTPLRGQDGGRDGETAPGNPYLEFQVGDIPLPSHESKEPPRAGRYLFQVKHHRTIDKRLSDARQAVIADFENELRNNVLNRQGDERVNHFFLITNVPASKEAIDKIDEKSKKLLKEIKDGYSLYADVWWQETVIGHLDNMPSIWNSFPEIFPGGRAPLLAGVAGGASGRLPRAVRLAISHQYGLDRHVKFRQIDLEQDLSRLFVDLDVYCQDLETLLPAMLPHLQPLRSSASELVQDTAGQQLDSVAAWYLQHIGGDSDEAVPRRLFAHGRTLPPISALNSLIQAAERIEMRKIVLEGGPGQGKSTITQMMAQIYRQQILGKSDIDPENRWTPPQRARLPFRVELRTFAEWLSKNPNASIERYLATVIAQDSGGNEISVDNIHSIVETSPVLLMFDGLDEVGSDTLRDNVLTAILECVQRFEDDLNADLRVIITTRPPAIAGRAERLTEFTRFTIAPMSRDRVSSYVTRWLSVQIKAENERQRIRDSFERRQREPHVQALATNPMQLSVLLQFINRKGEAFPVGRAELYRDYFQTVIDRDVEKSPELRENRQVVEALHEFLGYKLHALTEANQADRTLGRKRLLQFVRAWLSSQGNDPQMATRFFKIGEERFGLIVAPKGEGEETRYGYEVQPVQEYFAAAYISNQIRPPANAHEIFEAMIRRPYWREVALFLAGLRRRNEKADLIARAYQLDKNEELGWRLDGRALVLQLLQEGVLSEPRYVFSQALDIVLDLLDPKKVKVQHEPRALLDVLVALLKQGATEEHRKRLLELLQELRAYEDEYAIKRLYGVAHNVLEPREIRQQALLYKGRSLDLVAKVRLEWPYVWGIGICEMAKQPLFWDGVPESIWAESLWNAALKTGVVYDLSAPQQLHQRLVEQFAVNPTSIHQQLQNVKPLMEVHSDWAIWRLVSYQQMLCGAWSCKRESTDSFERLRQEILSRIMDSSEANFNGVDGSIAPSIQELIECSKCLLLSMCATEDKDERVALSDYIQRICEHLRKPGLAGWLACRSAVNLLKAALFEVPFRKGLISSEKVLDLGEGALIPNLLQELLPLYGQTSRKTKSSEFQHLLVDLSPSPFTHPSLKVHLPTSSNPTQFVVRSQRRFVHMTPSHVRLNSEEKPVAVVDLLAKSIQGKELPFKWMKHIPYRTEIVAPLVRKCKGSLKELLAALGTIRFSDIETGESLSPRDVKRVLKIANSNTGNPQILTGALIALANSAFLQLAQPDLVLELIRANSNKTEFASRIFRQRRIRMDDSDASSVREEIELAKQAARKILDSPDEYTFRVVCAAADYLAEHDQISWPPLLDEEEKLSIKVQQV